MGRWPVEDIQARKYNPEIDAFRYEKDFQQWLMNLGKRLGYLVYHTHQSRFSPAGFLDTVMVKKERLIFAELKTPWRPNPTEEQRQWLDALSMVEELAFERELGLNPYGPGVGYPEVYLWRSWELDSIIRVLQQ